MNRISGVSGTSSRSLTICPIPEPSAALLGGSPRSPSPPAFATAFAKGFDGQEGYGVTGRRA